jgi:hypothetical protein
MRKAAVAATLTLVVLVATATAATPKPRPAWAWTPFEATQVLIMGHPQWDTAATDCRRPGGGCDYPEKATCSPIGAAVWLGHYAAFRCSVVYRHWNLPGLYDNPTQSATLYVANSRTGLGTACVSSESLPTTCAGRPLPAPSNPPRLLFARLNTSTTPAYWRCTNTPNRNGVYRCVYAFRTTASMATIVLKPLSVALLPSSLSYHDAVCKVFGSTSSACKYS